MKNTNESCIPTPPALTKLGDNWFFEKKIPNCDKQFKIGVKIKEKLFETQSPIFHFEIFETVSFGKMLVIDGIIQTTEADNFVYHEMLTHLPMLSHPNPKNVLIIGGGDGGMLHEVLKYPVESVIMNEIDEQIVLACKTYMPNLSQGAFDDPRAMLHFEDGKEYIKKHTDAFDVIILDLSDPIGPAADLIALDFYRDVKKALRKDGVISIQSGSLTWQPKEVATINQRIKKVFSHAVVHKGVVSTYQGGEFSFTIASDLALENISLEELNKRYRTINGSTYYYTPKLHHASAVLPKHLQDLLNKTC